MNYSDIKIGEVFEIERKVWLDLNQSGVITTNFKLGNRYIDLDTKQIHTPYINGTGIYYIYIYKTINHPDTEYYKAVYL